MNVPNKLFTSKNRLTSRKAVAPVIATILLIAISVVSGGIIFAFASQSNAYLGFSNSPQIDTLEITGFDARDASLLILHDGVKVNNSTSPGDFDGKLGNGLVKGERVAVYVKNNSISTVYFSEVRFAGSELVFAPGGELTAYNTTFMNPGEFVVVTEGTTGIANLSSSAKIPPGQEATFLIKLGSNIPIQRDTSFKIVTTNGAGFVGSVYLGNHYGGI